MPTNTQNDTPAGQPPVLAPAHGSADFVSECDALIESTRKMTALPSDGCVIRSLAAQVLLAHRKKDKLLAAIEALNEIVEGVRNERWAANGRRLKDTPEWVRLYCEKLRCALPNDQDQARRL